MIENGASIQYRVNLLSTFKSPGKAIGQTERGIKWAIEFLESLDCEILSDNELKHALRLSYFRGNSCPVYRG